MKKYIAIALVLVIVLALCTGCMSRFAKELGYSKNEEQETPQILDKTKFDTAYPDHVYCSHRNAITVELAEEDLHKYANHSAVEKGTIKFSKSYLNEHGRTYVFSIRVKGEKVTSCYRAYVTYDLRPVWGSENQSEYRYKSCRVDWWGLA